MDSPQLEQAFCHSCNNRWTRNPHDFLQCPACHSEFVEIADPHEESPLAFPADDPEEDDIDDFNRAYPRPNRPPDTSPMGSDGAPPGLLLNNFMTMVNSILGPGPRQVGGGDGHRSPPPSNFHFEARGPGGSRFTYHSTYTTAGGLGGRSNSDDDIARLLDPFYAGSGFRPMNSQTARGGPQEGQQFPPNPLAHMILQLFDSANARAGDAVFSQEALDRVISELMENNQMGNAPGPATADSIANIPKVKLTKDMIGEEGTDEGDCSICMDPAKVGDEVTRLWCSHWFHTPCIEAWLREHDTCPHCRKGVEEARAEAEGRPPPEGGSGNKGPRSPDNHRNNSSQNPFNPFGPGSSGASQGPPGAFPTGFPPGTFGASGITMPPQPNQQHFHRYGHGYYGSGSGRFGPSYHFTTFQQPPSPLGPRPSAPLVPLDSRPNLRRSSTSSSSHRQNIWATGSNSPYRSQSHSHSHSHSTSTRPNHGSRRSSSSSRQHPHHSSSRERPTSERRNSGHRSHRDRTYTREPPPAPPSPSTLRTPRQVQMQVYQEGQEANSSMLGGFRETLRSLWGGGGAR